jgi:hypothetical protein
MKRFLINVFGFSLTVLALLHAYKATLPYYWANEEFCDKMVAFTQDSVGFNLVYLGPSAVKREFIPSVFDRRLKQRNIRAYNLGTAGVDYMEQNYLLRHVAVDSAFRDVEYLLGFGLEPKKILKEHYHRLRTKYCIDWASLSSGVKFFYAKEDYTQVYKYVITYLENQFLIGEVFDMMKWRFEEFSFPEELLKKSGYVPYEWSVAQEKKEETQRTKFLLKHEGQKYMAGYRKKPNKNRDKKLSDFHDVVADDMIQLQSFIHENGIEFCLVFQPNMNEYLKVSGLNQVYFGDGRKYEKYFEIENRWDHKHLNENGSIEHTKLLAKLFEEKFFEDAAEEIENTNDEDAEAKNKKGKKQAEAKGKEKSSKTKGRKKGKNKKDKNKKVGAKSKPGSKKKTKESSKRKNKKTDA